MYSLGDEHFPFEEGKSNKKTSSLNIVGGLVAQLCLTLSDPTNCSLSGSSVHGILQARILEWIAIPSSRGSSQLMDCALQADSLPSGPRGKPRILE